MPENEKINIEKSMAANFTHDNLEDSAFNNKYMGDDEAQGSIQQSMLDIIDQSLKHGNFKGKIHSMADKIFTKAFGSASDQYLKHLDSALVLDTSRYALVRAEQNIRRLAGDATDKGLKQLENLNRDIYGFYEELSKKNYDVAKQRLSQVQSKIDSVDFVKISDADIQNMFELINFDEKLNKIRNINEQVERNVFRPLEKGLKGVFDPLLRGLNKIPILGEIASGFGSDFLKSSTKEIRTGFQQTLEQRAQQKVMGALSMADRGSSTGTIIKDSVTGAIEDQVSNTIGDRVVNEVSGAIGTSGTAVGGSIPGGGAPTALSGLKSLGGALATPQGAIIAIVAAVAIGTIAVMAKTMASLNQAASKISHETELSYEQGLGYGVSRGYVQTALDSRYKVGGDIYNPIMNQMVSKYGIGPDRMEQLGVGASVFSKVNRMDSADTMGLFDLYSRGRIGNLQEDEEGYEIFRQMTADVATNAHKWGQSTKIIAEEMGKAAKSFSLFYRYGEDSVSTFAELTSRLTAVGMSLSDITGKMGQWVSLDQSIGFSSGMAMAGVYVDPYQSYFASMQGPEATAEYLDQILDQTTDRWGDLENNYAMATYLGQQFGKSPEEMIELQRQRNDMKILSEAGYGVDGKNLFNELLTKSGGIQNLFDRGKFSEVSRGMAGEAGLVGRDREAFLNKVSEYRGAYSAEFSGVDALKKVDTDLYEKMIERIDKGDLAIEDIQDEIWKGLEAKGDKEDMFNYLTSLSLQQESPFQREIIYHIRGIHETLNEFKKKLSGGIAGLLTGDGIASGAASGGVASMVGGIIGGALTLGNPAGIAAGSFIGGGVGAMAVNDALITKTGDVINLAADDDIFVSKRLQEVFRNLGRSQLSGGSQINEAVEEPLKLPDVHVHSNVVMDNGLELTVNDMAELGITQGDSYLKNIAATTLRG